MVILQAITAALNARKNRLLLFAQAAMSEHQFQAFRKLLLNELGRNGLEQDLVRIVNKRDPERRQGPE